MDNQTEQSEAHQNQEEAVISEETTSENELTTEQIAELKQKADVSSQNFERAKKAEAELKALKGEKDAPLQNPQFLPKDYLALTEFKVSSEDFDEVVRVAKILDKPISEALKDKTMKSILADRVEERRTANATQTGKANRGTTKSSGADILAAASQGKVPEDDAGIAALADARMAARTKK